MVASAFGPRLSQAEAVRQHLLGMGPPLVMSDNNSMSEDRLRWGEVAVHKGSKRWYTVREEAEYWRT